jgi:hypothetical protein
MEQKPPRPHLVPRDPWVQSITAAVLGELEASLVVEGLYLYQKPAAASQNGWTGEERAALYNQALALSTLAGIQYYSASRGQMRTFYESSTVIDSPESKKPRPDPRHAVPPAELRVYARQKDLTFGDTTYQYTYYAQAGAFVFIQKNIGALTYGIIPVIGREKLRSVVAVIDTGDCLLVYALSLAQTASIPGMKDRVNASFTNRAAAIMDWFARQADRAFTGEGWGGAG